VIKTRGISAAYVFKPAEGRLIRKSRAITIKIKKQRADTKYYGSSAPEHYFFSVNHNSYVGLHRDLALDNNAQRLQDCTS